MPAEVGTDEERIMLGSGFKKVRVLSLVAPL